MSAEQEEFQLAQEIRRAENIFHNTNRNFLVLGSAGTGKSFLLKRLVANSHKNLQVLAYTGLAALNAGGMTIHKFFGFELGLQARSHLRLKRSDEQKENRRHAFRNLEAILIDEVSMLRADLLDAVDAILREHGPWPGEPFGGVQVGLFGDVLQLPPIVENKDGIDQMFRPQANDPSVPISDEGWISPWFFDSFAYRTGGFLRLTLNHIFRQQTEAAEGVEFIRCLQRLREGRMQPEDFDLINSRVSNECLRQALSLVTTNRAAEAENTSRFSALPGKAKEYRASKAANWPKHWDGDEPVPVSVEIKKDAWVLVCANNAERGLVNGSLGTVLSFDDEEVVLRVGTREVSVRRYGWKFPIWRWDGENKKMVKDGETTYSQMPLKLAWAMTIHKAQGQTVDGPMWVDLGARVWSGGQAYVTLSRVRRLDQLHLRRAVRAEDVLVEKRARQFLSEGDTATALEETRALAATVYRQTKKVKDKAVEERERAEQILRDAKKVLTEATAKLQECKDLEARIAAYENRISSALEQAKKAGWLKRLLGDF